MKRTYEPLSAYHAFDVPISHLVRQLDPGTIGLPLEVYAFTKTVNWVGYETIQADIFEHLIAAVPQFDLRVFQQPTGVDFQALAGSGSAAC